MSSKRGTVIALRATAGAPARKLTKITEYNDGGFAVMAPYHRAREGHVGTVTMMRSRGEEQTIPWNETAFFSASERVKLSYHKDGFCQFSGERPGTIVSGVDQDTDLPKGVGIRTKPLSDPVISGPSFSLLAWGLDDFEEAAPGEQATILFEPEDLYHRRCTPSTANTFMLECLVLPKVHWEGVRRRGRDYVLTLAVPHIGRDPRSLFINAIEWKVMEMQKENILLALRLTHCATEWPSKHVSGWELCGPSETGGPDKPVRGLIAWYPGIIPFPAMGSIDRAPSGAPEAPPTTTMEPKPRV